MAFAMTPLAAASPARADFGIEEALDAVIDDVFGVAGPALFDLPASNALPAPGLLAGFDVMIGQVVQSLWMPLSLDMHAGVESWIVANGPVLQILNSLSENTGMGAMIANGADGTASHPDGFDGGWLFGDGGNGFDGAVGGGAHDGADGGDAGMFGNGGDGTTDGIDGQPGQEGRSV